MQYKPIPNTQLSPSIICLGVQPLSVVDKSDFCPSGLTVPSNTPYYLEALPVSYFFQAARNVMAFHVFLFLLVFFLLLSLALLCFLWWPHRGPARSRAAAKIRSTLPRLLKPRSPDDCPACRLASPASSARGPSPLPVRPWSEVKSRRGAPKRIDTQGFACPNPQCAYCGITDAHIHALVGDGKQGRAEQIQT